MGPLYKGQAPWSPLKVKHIGRVVFADVELPTSAGGSAAVASPQKQPRFVTEWETHLWEETPPLRYGDENTRLSRTCVTKTPRSATESNRHTTISRSISLYLSISLPLFSRSFDLSLFVSSLSFFDQYFLLTFSLALSLDLLFFLPIFLVLSLDLVRSPFQLFYLSPHALVSFPLCSYLSFSISISFSLISISHSFFPSCSVFESISVFSCLWLFASGDN